MVQILLQAKEELTQPTPECLELTTWSMSASEWTQLRGSGVKQEREPGRMSSMTWTRDAQAVTLPVFFW
jgi:hypothetical protein